MCLYRVTVNFLLPGGGGSLVLGGSSRHNAVVAVLIMYVVSLARWKRVGTAPIQLTSVDLCIGNGESLLITRDGVGAFSCYTA